MLFTKPNIGWFKFKQNPQTCDVCNQHSPYIIWGLWKGNMFINDLTAYAWICEPCLCKKLGLIQ